MVHRGEKVAFGTTDTKVLAHIAAATPLQAVGTVDEHVETPTALPNIESLYESPSHQEDVFTRHDTLNVPESSDADIEASMNDSELATISDVLNRVADVQEHASEKVIETEVIAPQHVEEKKEPVQDDSGLYSITNFSL
jgi:hypothetical protein